MSSSSRTTTTSSSSSNRLASPRKMRVAVDDLVNVFDNIPSIMNTMNANRAEPGRFHVLSPNHSGSMDSVLRGHSKKFGTSKQEKKRAQRMQQQATKVLEHLSKLSEEYEKKSKRSESESAMIALESIRNYANLLGHESKGITKMYNKYDVHRKGKISSKDFQASLLVSAPSLQPEEAKALTKKIDKHNTGVINYMNILNALEELKESQQKETSSDNRVTFAAVDSQENENLNKAPWEIYNTNNNNSNNNRTHPTPSKSVDVSELNDNPLTKLTSPVVVAAPTSAGQQFPEFEINAPHPGPESHPHIIEKHHFYINQETDVAKEKEKHHFSKTEQKESLEQEEHTHASKNSYLAHNMELSEGVHSLIVHKEEFYNPCHKYQRKMEYAHLAALKTVSAPYYVDHQDEEQLHETRRRSRSAPPALRKSNTFVEINNHDHVADLLKDFTPEVEKAEYKLISQGTVVDFDDNSNLKVHKTGKKMKSQIVVNQSVKRHMPSLDDEHDEIETFTLDPQQSIVTQLDGHIAPLRHILKKADASKSGVLNYEELNSALGKAGIQIDQHQVKSLFNQMARPMDACHSFGYTKGKAVYIDEFVDRLQTRSSPLVSSFAESVMRASKDAAERKIIKEVLHQTDKTVDSMKIFKDLDHDNSGWIGVDSLKEGLHRTGVSLTDNEFSSLVSKVSPNKEGKINVSEFKEKLKNDIHISDRDLAYQRLTDLHAHKRYSRSYKSDQVFLNCYLPEFEDSRTSKVLRKEDLAWSKLRKTMQIQSDKVESVFTKDIDKTELTVPEITARLANEGLPLGSDDINRLKNYLVKGANADGSIEPKVSVNTFCDIMGIPIGVDHHNKIKLKDPAESLKDGGVFLGAEKTTTFFISGEENSAWVKGNRRGRAELPPYEHVLEPSKFWKLEHGASAPEFILGMSPLPSTKDFDVTRSFKLYNRGRAAAGARTTDRSLHETSMFNDDSVMASRRRFFNPCTDNVLHGGNDDSVTSRRRSLSAPPTRSSNNDNSIDLSHDENNHFVSPVLGRATRYSSASTGARLNLSGGTESNSYVGAGQHVPDSHLKREIRSLKRQVLPPSYAALGTCPFATD